jgi:uncharacterized RDD family membrane protein YckC
VHDGFANGGCAYIAKRSFAALIDYGLCWGTVAVYGMLFGEVNAAGSYEVHGCLHILAVIAIWILVLPLPELLWGHGIGKGIFGLRVAPTNDPNAIPSLQAVAKRQVAAFLEIGMCAGILPLILILTSPKRQRLGDQWAQTTVVDENDVIVT